MLQAVAADLEQGIGDQLRRALGMGLHPLAAGKEGRLHAFGAEQIDDAAVIARDIAALLAEIEGEGDQLLVRRQRDALDQAAKRGLDRGRGRERCRFERGDFERTL